MAKYKTDGVCAKEIQYEVKDGKVSNVRFMGGCPGNLQAIGSLIEGMPVEEVVQKFKGNQCRNETSCVDQLARALEKHLV